MSVENKGRRTVDYVTSSIAIIVALLVSYYFYKWALGFAIGSLEYGKLSAEEVVFLGGHWMLKFAAMAFFFAVSFLMSSLYERYVDSTVYERELVHLGTPQQPYLERWRKTFLFGPILFFILAATLFLIGINDYIGFSDDYVRVSTWKEITSENVYTYSEMRYTENIEEDGYVKSIRFKFDDGTEYSLVPTYDHARMINTVSEINQNKILSTKEDSPFVRTPGMILQFFIVVTLLLIVIGLLNRFQKWFGMTRA